DRGGRTRGRADQTTRPHVGARIQLTPPAAARSAGRAGGTPPTRREGRADQGATGPGSYPRGARGPETTPLVDASPCGTRTDLDLGGGQGGGSRPAATARRAGRRRDRRGAVRCATATLFPGADVRRDAGVRRSVGLVAVGGVAVSGVVRRGYVLQPHRRLQGERVCQHAQRSVTAPPDRQSCGSADGKQCR